MPAILPVHGRERWDRLPEVCSLEPPNKPLRVYYDDHFFLSGMENETLRYQMACPMLEGKWQRRSLDVLLCAPKTALQETMPMSGLGSATY